MPGPFSDDIGLIVYAPEFKENDGRRSVAVVHGVERAFPAVRLDWTVSDDRQMLWLPQRDEWIAQGTRDGGFPFVCNNDLTFPVMVSGRAIPALLEPGPQALCRVYAHLPLNAAGAEAALAVLEAVAEAARAFWGHATPFDAGVALVSHPPRRGLPQLKKIDTLRSPEVPWHLGWLNYWSAATARLLGFPDPARDADLLSRSRRTASGGWVVRLTDELLNLDKSDHLDVVKRTYERFPEIGGRSAS